MDRLTAAEISMTASEIHPEPVDLDYWATLSIGVSDSFGSYRLLPVTARPDGSTLYGFESRAA